MSSVTRTFGADQAHPERMGRNLAVVSREYLNLHLRLGYHFTVWTPTWGPSERQRHLLPVPWAGHRGGAPLPAGGHGGRVLERFDSGCR
jgi:hypothetical protein